ncbi:chalcone isomerase family protein [Pasteurella multocida]|uniref:chalcone isomerase family protein n=1 Tax=Pasteurella multocida TaxID=747 RepID=UPI00202434A6|nr:chalcone isomerase family protein [Pasteurella multocida]URJ88115.1 chalcone isomerase family protein [Pasteurella multocida]URJ90111.1 chalcone isomerase family protein [Pasteurella multocida]HDR0618716.1 chalcone isomerase family protein [Pasteurella multocida]
MKINTLLFSLFCLFSSTLSAQWLNVGKADYNWGPFHVYTISLYTETGKYEENIRPLMLTFTYAKPIEGKNFAISLIKEIENLKLKEIDTKHYLNALKALFPDISPNDVLNYIALEERGYFVLNDTILDQEFDATFTQALISIWLSPNTNFPKLQPKLLGDEKPEKEEKFQNTTPKIAPLTEDSTNPELPPNYPLDNRENEVS